MILIAIHLPKRKPGGTQRSVCGISLTALDSQHARYRVRILPVHQKLSRCPVLDRIPSDYAGPYLLLMGSKKPDEEADQHQVHYDFQRLHALYDDGLSPLGHARSLRTMNRIWELRVIQARY